MPSQADSGQPAPGVSQSLPDLDAQVAYQRAFEATLWAMPAVAIDRFRVGLLSQPGMADNVIDAFDGPLHDFHELITPNQVTPYIGAVTDLRKGQWCWKFRPRQTKLFCTGKLSMRGSRRLQMSARQARTKAKAASISLSRPDYSGRIHRAPAKHLPHPFGVPLDPIGRRDRC